MNLMMILYSSMLMTAIMIIFYFMSKKEKWEKESAMSFECGYTSYFFSRFSFSIHYFLVALLFLFLDLELCFLMPFFNQPMMTETLKAKLMTLVLILLLSLMVEWKEGKISWKF